MKPESSSNITIMITGGHVTPAIAVIDELRLRYPTKNLVFVGRKHALEGEAVLSEEYRMITNLGIRFLPITAGRLKREGGLSQLAALCKVPIGFIQACVLVFREKPTLVVSFGGYVALPIAIAAYLFGVPIVTHEQTTRPGLANRLIARIASAICVSFPETAKRFWGGKKVIVTGLPMRREIIKPPSTSPIVLPKDAPVLLVVGGSTGSVSINNIVFRALPTLLDTYTVIHQVGRISEPELDHVIGKLPQTLRPRYIAKAYLSAGEYSWAIHHSRMVIGRSGANTVTEVALSGALAIFIPLPWAARNEQFFNAKYLEAAGSIVITQETVTSTSLVDAVYRIETSWEKRKAMAMQFAQTVPKDGARRLVEVIEQTIVFAR